MVKEKLVVSHLLNKKLGNLIFLMELLYKKVAYIWSEVGKYYSNLKCNPFNTLKLIKYNISNITQR